MYYEHFGLTQAPFKITPNTDFFFSGGNRGPVLEALIYAITRGEGIVKVTGEVGSGKTMLCNMLQSRLPDNVESVYLANPNVAPDEVLHAIAFDLHLGLDRDADRLEVLHALQEYLVRRHAEGHRVVVFIEESQSMPLATLEEIRLLSNLETRNDKLLQIVLFGQPELDENLRRRDIRQLRDRIAHSFRLQPLTDDEVRDYLMFRMRAAGYRGPEIFSPQVVRKIAKASSGLTRRVNLIADKALLAAFSENTHTIQPRHVEAALADSEFGQQQREPRWRLSPAVGWAGAMLVVGAAIGAGLHAFWEPKATAVPAASAHTAAPPAPVAAAPAPPSPQVQPTTTAPAATAPTEVSASTAPPAQQPESAARAGDTATATQLATAAPQATSDIVTGVAPTVAAPAAAAPSTAAEVGAYVKPLDFITDRLAATERWLATTRPDAFSVQLMIVSDDRRQLSNHLKALPKSIEPTELYMYRSALHGRRIINVLLGSYPDRETAQQVIEHLPVSLRSNRPYVRTVGVIRADAESQRKR